MGWTGQMDRQGGDRDTQNLQRICLGNSGSGMYPEPAASGGFGLRVWTSPGCGNSGMKLQGLDVIPLPLRLGLGCS